MLRDSTHLKTSIYLIIYSSRVFSNKPGRFISRIQLEFDPVLFQLFISFKVVDLLKQSSQIYIIPHNQIPDFIYRPIARGYSQNRILYQWISTFEVISSLALTNSKDISLSPRTGFIRGFPDSPLKQQKEISFSALILLTDQPILHE